MNKKEFLQEKYEEINRLKISIQDYPKESIDNILKSISNICDEINKHLEKKIIRRTVRLSMIIVKQMKESVSIKLKRI